MEHDVYNKIAVIAILFNPKDKEIENVLRISSFYKGVIVDNSSKSHFDGGRVNKMQYVGLCRNVGVAEAQNVGLEYVLKDKDVEYIFYFDQDSEFDDDYPVRMSEEFDYVRNSGIHVAALGPTVVQKETGEVYKSVIHRDKKVNEHFILRQSVIASGCCLGRNAIEVVGKNDASLFIDFVDSEWCWRAYQKGFVCGITPNVIIYHKIGQKELHIGSHIIIVSSPFRYFYQYRNYVMLAKRSYVPIKWKINKGLKFFLRFIYFPFVLKEGVECWKYMFKGLVSGIKILLTGKC